MFQELGPDAREVLGVVAFFPQGVNEDSIDREFPTISDGPSMFDIFCNLSLTYRGNGFIVMLAPLRDHLRPKDPMASTLLRTAKEYYFMRLSVELSPGKPAFDESQWITSEDVNIEHLLDIFTSIDADSEDVWGACIHFMDHLRWHKPRLTVLGLKVEALPDSHPSKPRCLLFLSRLFGVVGNLGERKRVLSWSLGLWRESGNDYWVADTLVDLCDANRALEFYEEGIQQAKEALDIFRRLGETEKQARCLIVLAGSLRDTQQLAAAEEAAIRAIDLSENCDQYRFCQSHHILGNIYQSKGDTEKAIHHFETSLRIASALNSRDELSRIHLGLAELYIEEDKLDDARAHIEYTKWYAGNDTFLFASALLVGAGILCQQNRFVEGKSEALGVLATFEKFGATVFVETTRAFLEKIEEVM